jgi:hypothetical protein
MLDCTTFRPDRDPCPRELFRLRGAKVDLRGLVFETSFGYGFGLELDTELILMHLQRTVKSLVAYAERWESALIAQGWQVIEPRQAGGSAYDVQ